MKYRMTPRMHKRIAEQAHSEIDYDKLADTIAKAVVKEELKERNKYSVSREWMKIILYPAFIGLGILMGFIALFSFYQIIKTLLAFGNDFESGVKSFVRIVGFFVLCYFSGGACLTTFYTNKELEKEKDRQFVASVFSNTFAIIALIIALFALLKDAL